MEDISSFVSYGKGYKSHNCTFELQMYECMYIDWLFWNTWLSFKVFKGLQAV